MAECSLLCRQGSAAAGDGGVRSPARRSPRGGRHPRPVTARRWSAPRCRIFGSLHRPYAPRASSRVTYDRTGSAAPALVHERSGNGAVRAGQAVLRAEAAAVHPRTCIPTRCQVGGHCCAWANPQPPCCTALPPVAVGACGSTAGAGNDGRYHRTAARSGLPRCAASHAQWCHACRLPAWTPRRSRGARSRPTVTAVSTAG